MRFCFLAALLMSFSVSAELVIEDAWVKLLPPSVPNSAGYFVIHNKGDSDRTLIAAKAGFADTAELHTHIMQEGMMRMEQQSRVVIPAGQSLSFEPGGLHVMLFGVQGPLKEQQTVNFELLAENGEALVVEATVRAPKASHHHHH